MVFIAVFRYGTCLRTWQPCHDSRCMCTRYPRRQTWDDLRTSTQCWVGPRTQLLSLPSLPWDLGNQTDVKTSRVGFIGINSHAKQTRGIRVLDADYFAGAGLEGTFKASAEAKGERPSAVSATVAPTMAVRTSGRDKDMSDSFGMN